MNVICIYCDLSLKIALMSAGIPLLKRGGAVKLRNTVSCALRARHWCLPHCPGQVEFVNYSCGASENCILLAPLGKYVLYISGLLLRMCASFVVCHPSLS